MDDDNSLIAERRAKLAAIRARGVPFPNDFKPRDRALELARRHGHLENEALEPQQVAVSVAGRMMLKRIMGKASFATLQDASGRIQLFVTRDALGEEGYERFKHLDLGDIVGAEGTLFKTRTGELSVRVSTLRLLTKSLRPLPDKFHGIADPEQKYRHRYIDLITDDAARARFMARSKTLSSIRRFMVEHGFMEVETPMLHPIPGGANAKPFVTHNVLPDTPNVKTVLVVDDGSAGSDEKFTRYGGVEFYSALEQGFARARLRRAQRRRHLPALHRRHHRLPQGRDVAPRGHLPGVVRRHRLCDRRIPSRTSTTWPRPPRRTRR